MRLAAARLCAIIASFLTASFIARAQTAPEGEKTVYIDFDNPECLFTGVKEGYESHDLWYGKLPADGIATFNALPFKYVNAPASKMPHGKSHRKENSFLSSAIVQDSTISPIAQIRQGDVVINFDWKRCNYYGSYEARIENNFPCRLTDADVKIGGNGYPSYYLYDLESGKYNLHSYAERYIYWQPYADITISVPEGYMITQICFAPLCENWNGNYDGAIKYLTFRSEPRTTSDISVHGDSIGLVERFGGLPTWGNGRYAATRWTPDGGTYRSVSIYTINGIGQSIASRSFAVSYAPDPDYVAPTDPTDELELSFTNMCSHFENTFFKSTEITLTANDAETQLFYTTDGTDPTDETNLARVVKTGSATIRATDSITVLCAARAPGKQYSPVMSRRLVPLDFESQGYIATVQRTDYTPSAGRPVLFTPYIHIFDRGTDGDYTWLTVCDAARPYRSLTLRSTVPFPPEYKPGFAFQALPMILERDSSGSIIGDASLFVADLYTPECVAESNLYSQISDSKEVPGLTDRHSMLRYTFVAADGDRMALNDSTSVRMIPQPGRSLPAFYPGNTNRVFAIADIDSNEPVLRIMQNVQCPKQPKFTVHGRKIEGSTVYFNVDTLLVNLTEVNDTATYRIVNPSSGRITPWPPEYSLLVTQSSNLEIDEILNGIGVSRPVYFRSVRPAAKVSLSNLQTSSNPSNYIYEVNEATAVIALYDDYALMCDSVGRLHLMHSGDNWGNMEVPLKTGITGYCVAKSTTPAGSPCSDITRYSTTMRPSLPPRTMRVDSVPVTTLAAGLESNVPVIITDAALGDNGSTIGGTEITLDYVLMERQRTRQAPPSTAMRYNIAGFMNGDSHFVVTSMHPLPQCPPPVFTLTPCVTDSTFLISSTLTISAEGDDATVKCTSDGSYPFTSPDSWTVSRPIRLSQDITITAAASRPGYSPSESVTVNLRRITREVSTLPALTDSIGRTLLFTGNLNIVTATGHYLIVRDVDNRRASIYNPDGWDTASLAIGGKLSSFIVRNDSGLLTTAGYAHTFSTADTATAPEKPHIMPPTSLADFALHQFVTARGKFDNSASFAGLPIVCGEISGADTIPANTSGRTYLLTALLTSTVDHKRCLMPVTLRDVSGNPPVITASCGDSKFWPEATVTIAHPSAAAEIFYRIDSGEWERYREPFTVSATATIEAYADETGYERNYAAPLTVTRMQQCGSVAITAEYADDGAARVTLTADEPGTIIYTADSTDPFLSSTATAYSAPFELRESAVVRAFLRSAGKADGPETSSAVNVTLIIPEPEEPGDTVTPPGGPVEPGDTINPPIEPDIPDAITDPSTDRYTVTAEGNTLCAPRGSRVYDLTGRLMYPNSTDSRRSDAMPRDLYTLPRGIYIVITPDHRSRKYLLP